MVNALAATHSDTINEMTDKLVGGGSGGSSRAQLSTSKRAHFPFVCQTNRNLIRFVKQS